MSPPAKTVLSREASIAFARALSEPPAPNPALLKAARQYSFSREIAARPG